MASAEGVTVEIPGYTAAPAQQSKLSSSRAANLEDHYAPGAAPSAAAAAADSAPDGALSWLQSNFYLILFCFGWLFFPCWWAAALLGLKAGRTGRSRLSRQERTAWQASVVLSIIGLVIFLLFIIWYGANPAGAKATVIRYTGFGSPANMQEAPPSLSPEASPSPTLDTVLKPKLTLFIAAAGPCNETRHDALVHSVNASIVGSAPAGVQDNIVVSKGTCTNETTAGSTRRLLGVTSKMQVLVSTANNTNSTALETVTQHLKSVIAASEAAVNATDLAWCGSFCQDNAADIDTKLSGAEYAVEEVYSCGAYTCKSEPLLAGTVLPAGVVPSDKLCCQAAASPVVPVEGPDAPAAGTNGSATGSCGAVTCANGGICSSGVCSCINGWKGSDCTTSTCTNANYQCGSGTPNVGAEFTGSPTDEACCDECAAFDCGANPKRVPAPQLAKGTATEELCCALPVVERAVVEVGVSANTPTCNETVNQQLAEETRLQVTDGMQPREASNIVVLVQDCQPAAQATKSALWPSRSAGGVNVKLVITLKDSIKSAAAVKDATKALIEAVGISTGDALHPNASLSSLVAMLNNELKTESKQQELLQKINGAIAADPSLSAAFKNATAVEGELTVLRS
uniref:EGF-like domain-containing protein n=1 Tax=Tetradesmus obliquus TaxID=3088 RepID=A0A383VSS1_TETOB|eukprot:jgi/Sobl393_1/15134/SZX67963.1